MKKLEKIGWGIVIALALITSVAAIGRFVTLTSGAEQKTPIDASGTFDVRYSQNPVLTNLHMLPGVIFMILGPLQFSRRIRAKWLGFHRWSGRVFLVIGLAGAIFGMALAIRLPAFGGLNTTVATYFFGLIFVFCAMKAYYHVRRREILLHREWMMRAFAIGLGVSTIRIVVAVFVILAHQRMEEVFGIAFWLGWSINLIAAEVWINLTRVRPHAVA